MSSLQAALSEVFTNSDLKWLYWFFPDHLGKYWVIRLMIVSELQSPDGDVKVVRSLWCQIAGYIMIYLYSLCCPTYFGVPPSIKSKRFLQIFHVKSFLIIKYFFLNIKWLILFGMELINSLRRMIIFSSFLSKYNKSQE